MIDGISGIITTIAGTGTLGFSGDGGNAKLAELDDPRGVFVDSSTGTMVANVYSLNHPTDLLFIRCIHLIAGNVYIAGGHRIRLLTPPPTASPTPPSL